VNNLTPDILTINRSDFKQSMRKQPTREFGRADLIDRALGLDDIIGPKLASIVVFTANIEYHLERAIWALGDIDPKGIRPETDGIPITVLISILEKHAAQEPDDTDRDLLETWCRAARAGFIIRNNIAHGLTGKMGETVVFFRNTQWHGETRNRAFGDLWCDPATLDMIRESLATLLRIIVAIAKDEKRLGEIASPLALKAAHEARSILGELADQFYNPSFEK